jgi:hypothetical protein
MNGNNPDLNHLKLTQNKICPFGHKFHTDFAQTEDCDKCDGWGACSDGLERKSVTD